MPCGFCSRPQTQFHCPACARSVLYPLRLRYLDTLVDKESLESQSSYVLGVRPAEALPSGLSAETKISLGLAAKAKAYRSLRDEIATMQDQVRHVHIQTKALREKMEAWRNDMAERRAENAERLAHLDANGTLLRRQKEQTLEPLRKSNRKQSLRHETLHRSIVSARRFLCREAASLAGVRQKSELGEGDMARETPAIAGVPIFDLRKLNDMPVDQLTFSLSNTARMLDLICRYLQVRLPAEIILPHKDYPFCAMLMPGSSYSERTLSLPQSSLSPHGKDTNASHRKSSRLRPRPLHVDKKLTQLSKEDPAAYSLFIEGTTLLAWDVAWLCRAQGLNVADEEWVGLATVGSNLLQLLRAPSQERDVQKRQDTKKEAAIKLGQPSHGSALFFLASGSQLRAVDQESVAMSWRYGNPVKVFDKVRGHLHNEMTGHEWEVLDEREADEDNIEGDPVVVNARGHTKRAAGGAGRSAALSEDSRVDSSSGREDRTNSEDVRRGQSGWTKLKSRSSGV